VADDSAQQVPDLTMVHPTPKPERRRTKPPLRRVPSDSFKIEVDGVKYYPHYGEWVEFVPVVQLDTLLTAMTLQGLQDVDMSNVSAEDAAQVNAAFSSVTEDLSRAIVRWSWTGNEDPPVPFPENPAKEDLRRLSLEELMWLVGASFSGRVSEEEESRGEDSSD
jgi:hypothetical protein